MTRLGRPVTTAGTVALPAHPRDGASRRSRADVGAMQDDPDHLRRLLKALWRLRALPEGGGLLERARHRWRRRSLLARLAAEWPGGAVEHVTGDLVVVPRLLDARGLACLLHPPRAHPAALAVLSPGSVAVDVGANLGEWT